MNNEEKIILDFIKRINNDDSDKDFFLGEKSIVNVLLGKKNSLIEYYKLDKLKEFGILNYLNENKLNKMLNNLLENKFLITEKVNNNLSVIKVNTKKKLTETKLEKKEDNVFSKELEITEQDKKIFVNFDFFLKDLDIAQKKAIISTADKILCVAGAGSGKTRVLTKRIIFLTKFRGVEEKKILAITFTHKAKEEIKERLLNENISKVNVETFNSFSEKILQKYGEKIYSKKTKVITFKKRLEIVRNFFVENNLSFNDISKIYFSKSLLNSKNKEELFYKFVNDVFSILDFYKNLPLKNNFSQMFNELNFYKLNLINKFYLNIKNLDKREIGKIVYQLLIYITNYMNKNGLRDFSDQILDTLKLFEKDKEIIPKFDYILIDEFQDINYPQYKLIKILNPKNIFIVGDPRQAIFGWRGSDIKYILDLPKKENNFEIINLTKNYRSNEEIVNLANQVIRPLNFLDLEVSKNEKKFTNEKPLNFREFNSENEEINFVVNDISEKLKSGKYKPKDIFILSRTNKNLDKYTKYLKEKKIKFFVRNDDEKIPMNNEQKDDEILLATVHSIKGLEAKVVYLIQVNNKNYPNKTQDNFLINAIKKNQVDYDKEEEELRLLYVAITRAKEILYITYTKKISKFLDFDLEVKNKSLLDLQKRLFSKTKKSTSTSLIREDLEYWRKEKSKEYNLPENFLLSDKQIDVLITYKPRTFKDFYKIKELREGNIIKYGKEILSILNNY